MLSRNARDRLADRADAAPHGLGGRPWLALGIVAMLTVGTSLPWFAGQLMPDILFPAAVLALHLLAFRGEH